MPPHVITRQVTPDMSSCLLTHMERESIDTDAAAHQHARYVEVIESLGATVTVLPPLPESPDAVFVEDTIHVTDHVAVMSRPNDPRRRAERETMEAVIKEMRPVAHLTEPAKFEGGDVIRVGRQIYVGLSDRTDQVGIDQFEAIVGKYGYKVTAVDVTGCLHLKTAGTWIGGETILVNPAWCDTSAFKGLEVLAVDPSEPWAGNALFINGTVVLVEGFDRTRELVEATGRRVVTAPNSELAKAEGGLTCCSVIVDDPA